jgi:glycosyltransferase involved in cell wall biosynthesis
MRIAMIAPPYRPVPPQGYGGIERVIDRFVHRLVQEGHDVTLFALAGSRAPCRVVEIPAAHPGKAPSGVRRAADVISEEPLCEAMQACFRTWRPDVIHDWSFQNLFVLRDRRIPFLVSTCIPPAPGDRRPNWVACSAAHAALCGGGTKYVHYGLDFAAWPFSPAGADHVVQVAKIAPYKGQHVAIRAARKARVPLVLAGNVESAFYYYSRVLPLIALSRNVRHIGEISDTGACLRQARALVQAPLWFDAFPLIVLESFASGTPVVALAEGGIPEQIDEGVTGFLCRSADEMAAALGRVGELDRAACRDRAAERFPVSRMTRSYQELYERVLDGETW